MATLEDIYRDVNSRVQELNIDQKEISHEDTVKAINDAIREIRVEYVKAGVGNEFAITESLSSFTEDTNYPFLQSDTLSQEILDDLPIEIVFLSSTGYTTDNTIENTTQIFDKGDVARKGSNLYRCVESFSGVNTFDATFDKRDYRTFSEGNGRDYFKDDIIYVKDTDQYFKVNSDFTNNTTTSPSSITELDKLYWKRIDDASIYVSHYPFSNVQVLRTFSSLGRVGGISARGNVLYASDNLTNVVLTYVPKWEKVNTLSTTLDLPDKMIPSIKHRAVAILASKLNVKYQLAEQEQNE